MVRSLVNYDKDLPAIASRRPWERPAFHLIKDDKASNGWREAAGRRESSLLLVPKIRQAVDVWRDGGYDGASPVTKRLFQYWFEEEHIVPDFDPPFRFHFCQREAVETVVWLIEIAGVRTTRKLIEQHATQYKTNLFTDNFRFDTTMDGQLRLHRYVPELDNEGVQELPPETLRRFAFKQATGSGKTWVMAMFIVWARLHKQLVAGSDLSSNFLIVAPNVIVYQRLEKDFANNRIFHQLPLIPTEWKGAFSQKVILREETNEPDLADNLFLTNIHQLHESREQEWTPGSAIEALLGKKPNKDLAASGQRSMLRRLKSLQDLIVINDEAHHVHRSDLAWTSSLLAIHSALPRGLNVWLDFSATPKDQNGMYYPWTVCDYPLAQAVEDRIVKAPLIVTQEADPQRPTEDPDGITKENVCEKFSYWLHAAVQRWKEHWKVYRRLDTKPVLFVMAENNAHADAIGKYLSENKEFGFKQSEVLVIHTDRSGEITKKDLETARQAARDIDSAQSTIKVIVSVMMLREGWDVRNVSIVLGLRPFTAKSEILPEQVIGRGLRLMTQVGPDRAQTLEVLGTRNLLKVLREQLEAEGVGVVETSIAPPHPVTIEPIKEKQQYDVALPITKPRLKHEVRKLKALKVNTLGAIHNQEDLDERLSIRLKMEFAPTNTEIHQADMAAGVVPLAGESLAKITNKVIDQAKLPSRFAELYPIVEEYISQRCFGIPVDLEDERVGSYLARLDIQEGIAKYLARNIADLVTERREIEFEKEDFCLSTIKSFPWRRNLPPLTANKTIFNYVATYNAFERQFAEFLDKAEDILRFAALGSTEQGTSGTQFRIDYLKPSGAIGFYFPDWVAVQKTRSREVNWIIETKGRVWTGTEQKDAAAQDWCECVSKTTGDTWRYTRINQSEFTDEYKTFRAFILRRALKASSELKASMKPVTQEEIRRWKEEGRR